MPDPCSDRRSSRRRASASRTLQDLVEAIPRCATRRRGSIEGSDGDDARTTATRYATHGPVSRVCIGRLAARNMNISADAQKPSLLDEVVRESEGHGYED